MYTTRQLNRARKLAYALSGITLGANKDIMISNRLDKLKRDMNNNDIDAVLSLVESGKECELFINTFTTNKTNFFRERFHFDDLKDRVCKEAIRHKNELKIYCSAASTGEEPYSILMTLEQAKEEFESYALNYSLVATDIDTNVLNKASSGIYEWNKNAFDFPEWIQPSKYFKRRVHPTNNNDYLIKIKDNLLKKANFNTHNLMAEHYPFNHSEFDVIFCRNVLIYFSQEDQNKILMQLHKTLKVGGTLYLGHSESPLKLAPYLKRHGQNIFIKEKEL